jgi:hypothetical protein
MRNQNVPGGLSPDLSGVLVSACGLPLRFRAFITNAHQHPKKVAWVQIPSSGGSHNDGLCDFAINFCGLIRRESNQLSMKMAGLNWKAGSNSQNIKVAVLQYLLNMRRLHKPKAEL